MAKTKNDAPQPEAGDDDAPTTDPVADVVAAVDAVTVDPGYEAITLSDGTTYYRTLDASFGSFDRATIEEKVAAIRLRMRNFVI